MFGFFKNLLRKAPGGSAESEPSDVSEPIPTAVPAHPQASPNVAQSRKNLASPSGRGIELPLQSIISNLPLEIQPKVRLTDVGDLTITVPLEKILAQLSRGAVKISFGELRQAVPEVFTTENDRDRVLVSLPLSDILTRLNPALITRRRVQRHVQVPSEISSPFDGHGQGLVFSIGPTKPSAAAPVPPIAPARHTAPAAPARADFTTAPAAPIPGLTPAPAQNRINLAPTPPARPAEPAKAPSAPAAIPFAAPTAKATPAPAKASPAPAARPSPAPVAKPSPAAAPAPAPAPIPFVTPAAPAKQAAPTLKTEPLAPDAEDDHKAPEPKLQPSAPAPAAPAKPAAQPAAPAPSGESFVLALSLVADNWPEPIRKEIVELNLVDAKLAMPANVIEQSLKQGRIAFSWKMLRSWIRPQLAPTVSGHDGMVLELPLKTVAPLFMAKQKQAKPHQKVKVDEEIPNLFFGFPQPETGVPVAQATAKPSDTNFYVWDENSDRARVDESDTKKTPTPGTRFVAKYATPNEVVSRASALDGVAGVLIALPDGLMVANKLPGDVNADTIAAFLPQIFGKVSQCTKELRMGDLNNLNFTVGNIPWKIFRVNAIFFAAFGRAGEALPTAQLAALAAELDHKPR